MNFILLSFWFNSKKPLVRANIILRFFLIAKHPIGLPTFIVLFLPFMGLNLLSWQLFISTQ